MSIDSQRVEIEHIRRKVGEWQFQQPDFEHRLRLAARHWLHPALSTLGMLEREFAEAYICKSGTVALYYLLCEQAFADKYNDESLFDRYINGPGRWESGLCYRYLHRLANSTPSLCCVVSLENGNHVNVMPHGGGATLSVHDHAYASDFEVDDLLVTRVIDLPAGPIFGGAVINFKNVEQRAVSNSPEGIRELLSLSATELLQLAESSSTPDRSTSGGSASDRQSRGNSASGRDKPGRGSPPGGERGSRRKDDKASPHKPDGKQPPEDTASIRLLDRVRKLFAMAQQTDASPHEAEIALRRCQSLMDKYGITEADLTTSAFGNAEFATGRTVAMHLRYLASAVAKLHDVLFVTTNGDFAEFRGFEVDANVARLTLDYLLDAVERSLKARKRMGDFPAGRSAAYDYRIGFAMEVSRRAKELVSERKQRQEQACGTGTSLAVRKREIVDRECGQGLLTSTFRGRQARDSAARAAGTKDGARVSLDRQVGGRAARPVLSRS